MSSMSGNLSNKFLNNIFSNKENTQSFLYFLLTLFIILIFLLYLFYYLNLKSSECSFMNSMYGTLNGSIKPINNVDKLFSYTLKDYYIKSAYNSCNGGNYKNDFVDICNLKALLKQGVRGLDFEVFSINNQPVVSSSTNSNYCIKETFNSIDFGTILKTLNNYAFTMSGSPNPTDPLILHLRIKSNNIKMYDNFAKLLESYENLLLGPDYSYEYQGKNLGDVPLVNLMSKLIIIVDKSNNTYLQSKSFYEYVNMTSNSIFMRCLHYYDIKYTPDINELIEFNKLNMTIGLPDKGANPNNPSSLVMREMGIQLLGMRYSKVDTNIEENDAFFNSAGYAFVLKPPKLRYKLVEIERPPPQNPNVSYETRVVKSDFYNFNI